MSMVQNHYEINVSVLVQSRHGFEQSRYVHLFATDERSCVTEQDMQKVYRELLTRFPWPAFNIEVTAIECCGRKVRAPLPGEGVQLPDVNI